MTEEHSKKKKQSLLSKSIEHAIAVTDNDNAEQFAIAEVLQLSAEKIKINQETYLLVVNHKQGFDAARLAVRYNPVLKKYDYIVGDWGYGQLRLRGFYDDQRPQVKIDQKISTLQDYLLEYCNFGCAYFVIERERKLPYATKLKPRNHRYKRRVVKTPKIVSKTKPSQAAKALHSSKKNTKFKIRNLGK